MRVDIPSILCALNDESLVVMVSRGKWTPGGTNNPGELR